MKIAIMATEIFGILSLLSILYGTIFETKLRSRKRRAFIILSVIVLITLLVDAVSYLPYNNNNEHILYVITYFSFILPYFVYAAFLNYLYETVAAKTEFNKRFAIAGYAYSAFAVVIFSVFIFQGGMYTVANGTYSNGKYYNYYLLAYVLLLVYIFSLAILISKKIGIHDSVAALLFLFIPVTFIIINMFFPDAAFAIASLAIDMQVINTMLQGEREQSLIEQENVASKRAHYDELTGIPNRLAFSEFCDNVNDDGLIGVLFCDVNGLKYTNDHFGHIAGDKLLCDFTNLLKENFEEKNIFRISGDEFVVFVEDEKEAMFTDKLNSLILQIDAEEVAVASVGAAYGSKSQINVLLDKAEDKMYINKKEFREKHPKYSR